MHGCSGTDGDFVMGYGTPETRRDTAENRLFFSLPGAAYGIASHVRTAVVGETPGRPLLAPQPTSAAAASYPTDPSDAGDQWPREGDEGQRSQRFASVLRQNNLRIATKYLTDTGRAHCQTVEGQPTAMPS